MSSFQLNSQKRLACDRCHNKKIRCIVPQPGEPCSRCQKQELKCNFSPPAKTGRPAHHHRQDTRRTRTTPSASSQKETPSQSFSSQAPSSSMFSASGAHAPYGGFETLPHSLESSSYQGPIFYQTDYPVFDGNMVVEPDGLSPPKIDTSVFRPNASSLLTPASIDQGYELGMSPLTTTSSMSVPLYALFGGPADLSGHVGRQGHSPATSVEPDIASVLQSGVLDTEEVGREFLRIQHILQSCVSPHGVEEDRRVENLMQATESLQQVLNPYFQPSPQSPSISQSLSPFVVKNMLDTVAMAVDGFNSVLHPFEPSRTNSAQRPASQQQSTPPRTMTPQAFGSHSPMPAAPSPMLAPLPGYTPNWHVQGARANPRALAIPRTPGGHSSSHGSRAASLSGSSPAPQAGTLQALRSQPPLAPAMSIHTFPMSSELRLGHYVSHNADLIRHVFATAMHYHVRSLKKLLDNISVCLNYSPGLQQTVSDSLEQLSVRLSGVIGQVKLMVQLSGGNDP